MLCWPRVHIKNDVTFNESARSFKFPARSKHRKSWSRKRLTNIRCSYSSSRPAGQASGSRYQTLGRKWKCAAWLLERLVLIKPRAIFISGRRARVSPRWPGRVEFGFTLSRSQTFGSRRQQTREGKNKRHVQEGVSALPWEATGQNCWQDDADEKIWNNIHRDNFSKHSVFSEKDRMNPKSYENHFNFQDQTGLALSNLPRSMSPSVHRDVIGLLIRRWSIILCQICKNSESSLAFQLYCPCLGRKHANSGAVVRNSLQQLSRFLWSVKQSSGTILYI